MNRTARSTDAILLLSIWVGAAALVQFPVFTANTNILEPAVIADLTITAALVHWYLGIRKGALPKWTLMPVLVIGALLSAILIPGSGAVGLALAGVAELAVAGVALGRFRTIHRAFRKRRSVGANRTDSLEHGLAEALESKGLARAIMTELESISLGVFGAFQKPDVPAGSRGFTHHRNSGRYRIASAIVLLSLIEGTVLHLFLIHKGWTVAAWAMTMLHLYGLVWLVGDTQALRLRPTLAREAHLEIRMGLRWKATVPYSQIVSAERCVTAIGEEFDISPVDGPNVRLVFDREIHFEGFFGLQRDTPSVALRVDSPEDFVSAIGNPKA